MASIQYGSSGTPLQCPVCGSAIDIRLAKGRTSGKAFLMVVCPTDGRHFRGFINDRDYVANVVTKLERLSAEASGP